MLKLMYGMPSSDLAGLLIERAKSEGGRQIFIVPQHFSHEYERMLCRVYGDSASRFAEVLTMGRMCRRVLGEQDGCLDDAGRLLVLRLAARKVETQMKVLAPFVRRPEFLMKVVQVIDELKACRVDITTFAQATEKMEGATASRMRDLALLYAAYDAELGRLSDPRDRFTRLAEVLKEGWAAGCRVKVYGFTEFNEQELEILRVLIETSDEVCVALEHEPTHPAPPDSPFYAQARAAQTLKTLAKYDISEEIIPSGRAPRSDEMLFLERALTSETPLQYDGDCKVVHLYTEQSIRVEVERCAAHILQLARSGVMYRDMAVALPDEGDFRGIIQAVFEGWGIPVFYDSVEGISHKPVVAAAISAVDIITGGFQASDMSRYLKTGLAPIGFNSSCRLENYLHMWDIGRREWMQEGDWRMNPYGFSAEEDEYSQRELSYINEARQSVAKPFLRFLSAVSRGREYPASVLVEEFYKFLENLRLDTAISKREAELRHSGELRAASEYARLWGIICDILDTAHEILSDLPMTFDEFASMFKLLVEGAEVGAIPAALDGVPVGSAARLRHRDVSHLFLLGARSGQFPPASRSDGLLSDAEREELCALGLPVVPPSERLSYRSYDAEFAVLTLARQSLYISWTVSDGGTPAFAVERLMRMFGITPSGESTRSRLLYAPLPALHLALEAAAGGGDEYSHAALEVVACRDEYAAILQAARSAAECGRGSLSPASVTALYGQKPVLTASRVEQYKACAFGYFMRYGLYARAKKRASIDRPEAGSAIHEVLERTIRQISAERLLDGEITAAATQRAHVLAEKYLHEYTARHAVMSGLDRHTVEMMRGVVARSVDCVLEELSQSEFRPQCFELGFGGSGEVSAIDIDGMAELHGSVDRVDTWQSPDGRLYMRVMDYKSGRKKFSYTDIFHGSQMQLFIYLFALQNRGESLFGSSPTGAGVLYSPVRDDAASVSRDAQEDEIYKEKTKLKRRSGLLLGDRAVIDAMEHGEVKQFLPVEYKKDGGFNMRSSYVATPEQFAMLERHTARVLKEAAASLLCGNIEAVPSYSGGRMHCEICDYRAACAYDETCGRDHARYYYSVRANELWQKLGGDGSGV